VTLPEGGWLAARCHGTEHYPFQGGYAHTSPVTVRVGGRPPKTDPAAVAGLITHVERMLAWVEREARCENDRQRERLADIFRGARDVLAGRQGGC
jgi:hypothetical protein